MQTFIKIHPKDKVAVALQPMCAHSVVTVDGDRIVLTDEIMQGHKFALCDMEEGEQVIKYGAPIGIAKERIAKGSWVHTHNMRTGLGDLLTYTYEPCGTEGVESRGFGATGPAASFQGFRRPDGKAGVRNEVWIIPTVGCVNSVAAAIEKRARDSIGEMGSVEAVAAFSHPYGCSQMGEDQENTRRILADLVRHPNAGGVLVLGLGCENSNVEVLKEYIGPYDSARVKFLVCQEVEEEVEAGVRLGRELVQYAGGFVRTKIPCSELIVGMKCGGSDGLSGITANPAVGVFSDLLIEAGGTTILTEVPEMFGAETLLMNRCENRELFEKTVTMINGFKEYFIRHDQTVYENPSPGNKMGGISTLEDKSLGCTQKSGSAPVRGVLAYGETAEGKGLHLLSAPGNDLVAATALAAAGAQIVLFTTGRGTPFASPVPTVKIASNDSLYRHKKNWIDFNCGEMVQGKPLEVLGGELFRYVLEAASGRKVKAEEAGFHDMAIFKQGVTL